MPPNNPDTCGNTQAKSPNRVAKIPHDVKDVAEEMANMPKSPNLRGETPTENKTVTQNRDKKQKYPHLRPMTPTENKTDRQDVVKKATSPNLKVKTPTGNKTLRQDEVNIPKSPNLKVKKPMEKKTVRLDDVNLPKSPNLRLKAQTVNQNEYIMPKSPNSRVKAPTQSKTVRQEEVKISKSPNLRVKVATENKTVDQGGGSLPTSPKPKVKIPTERKYATQEVSFSVPQEKAQKKAEVNLDPWTLKKIAVTFAKGTSNHGFNNSNNLWIAGYKICSLFLLTTSLFLPVIGFLFGFIGVRDMLQPDYFTTQIKMINDKETGLALPRIILSYSGLFNYTALEEYNVSRYEASLITTLLMGEVAYTDSLERNIEKVNKDYHALLMRLNTTAWGVWNLLSYKCHELIIDCLFNGQHTPGPACCKKHFDTVIGDFGVSYVSKSTFTQEREEIPAGLTLSLRVPNHPFDVDWEYMHGDAILLKTGLRVSVLDSSKDYSAGFSSTTPVLGNDRILVSLSYDQHDNTGLYQSLIPWLDATADCTPDDAPFREQAAVLDNCMGSSLHVCGQQLRNCNIVSYPFWNGRDRFCDFKDQVAMIHSKSVAECRSDHVDNCGNLCQENVYRFSVQTCPLLEFSELRVKGNNSTWYVEGAFTMFYTHLGHNLITKSRANLVNLLSTLGGTMGLFMGASILNLGEQTTVVSGIIIWTVATIRRKFSDHRKRKLV